MSVMHNINHILRQSRLRRGLAAPEADAFSPWPFVDTLFDFTQVVGPGAVLATNLPAGKRVAVVGAGAAG